jgi:hypothetical protein
LIKAFESYASKRGFLRNRSHVWLRGAVMILIRLREMGKFISGHSFDEISSEDAPARILLGAEKAAAEPAANESNIPSQTPTSPILGVQSAVQRPAKGEHSQEEMTQHSAPIAGVQSAVQHLAKGAEAPSP